MKAREDVARDRGAELEQLAKAQARERSRLEELELQMSRTFDTAERAGLATEMTQVILDDNGFIFASHLRMSIVSGAGVSGLTAHPCDYYEITAELDKN